MPPRSHIYRKQVQNDVTNIPVCSNFNSYGKVAKIEENVCLHSVWTLIDVHRCPNKNIDVYTSFSFLKNIDFNGVKTNTKMRVFFSLN